MRQQEVYYAGIDLHRTNSVITILDERGYVRSCTKVQNEDTNKLAEVLLQYNKKVIAGVEATFGWYWMDDVLSEYKNIELRLGNPTKIHKLSTNQNKTDKIDSKFMADLLRSNLYPEVHKTSKPNRELKEVLRYRSNLVRHRASIKIRMRSSVAKLNLRCPYRDIAGKRSRKWLKKMISKYPYAEQMNGSLRVVDSLDEEIKGMDSKLTKIARKHPQMKIMVSIPGIGPITGLTILSEIDDIHRFPSSRKLCAYAGLTPKVKKSANKTHMGNAVKGNVYIRAMLAESFNHAIRKDKWLKAKYEKLKEKKNKSKAKVAVMRSMLTSIYFMLLNNKMYKFRETVTDKNKPGRILSQKAQA